MLNIDIPFLDKFRYRATNRQLSIIFSISTRVVRYRIRKLLEIGLIELYGGEKTMVSKSNTIQFYKITDKGLRLCYDYSKIPLTKKETLMAFRIVS